MSVLISKYCQVIDIFPHLMMASSTNYRRNGIIDTTLLRVINSSCFVILRNCHLVAWFIYNCSCHQQDEHAPAPHAAFFMLLPVEQKEQVVKSLPEFSTKAEIHQVLSNWEVLLSQCILNQQLPFLKINWLAKELLHPNYPTCGICSGFVTRDTTFLLRNKSLVVIFSKKLTDHIWLSLSRTYYEGLGDR